MKVIDKLLKRIQGLYHAINRFFFTVIFLIALMITNAISIQNINNDYSSLQFTFLIGVVLSAVVQVIYERFLKMFYLRFILLGCSAIIVIGYYFIVGSDKLSYVATARSLVGIFALIIAFILIPIIKEKYTFNDSFLATFKSLFISLFFTTILFIGVSLIISAINVLLFQLDYESYAHSANIIYVLIAPVYFLSLIPVYQFKSEKEEQHLLKMITCPKFLEILISYIIIPLSVVFTLILVIYIFMNIGNEFWSNNLLEPMLVTYSIVVIFVFILSGTLINKTVELFRKIFPKILVIIVLLQTISSVIKIGDNGITFSRYNVILYGIFAICAGLIFSFMSLKKTWIVAFLLIILSFISITPPVDAITVSTRNQIGMLKDVLEKNNMLIDNTIIPNKEISNNDKYIITQTVSYIDLIGYEDKIAWLDDDFVIYNDFYQTFGFSEYYEGQDSEYEQEYFDLFLEENTVIDIKDYDNLVRTSISIEKGAVENKVIANIDYNDKSYKLITTTLNNISILKLSDENDNLIIESDLKELFSTIDTNKTGKIQMPLEDATFIVENGDASLKIVIQSISINKSSEEAFYYADLYIMTNIK